MQDPLEMDAKTSMDVTGTAGVTIIMSDPGLASEIFARIMRENLRDDR